MPKLKTVQRSHLVPVSDFYFHKFFASQARHGSKAGRQAVPTTYQGQKQKETDQPIPTVRFRIVPGVPASYAVKHVVYVVRIIIVFLFQGRQY